MLRFIAQHRVLLLIMLLSIISLHLLSTGVKRQTDVGLVGKIVLAVYTPIYKVINWPFAKTANGIGAYLYLVDVKEQNRQLHSEVRQLRGDIVELAELRTENDRLRRLLNLDLGDVQPVAHARVIGRGSQSPFQVMLIDAGSRRGVARGMAVVAPDGLVGFVTAVTINAAKIVLLTDASARVDAILQRSRQRAMVFGRGGTTCSLEYLNSDADVEAGDRVVTSGLGGLFPAGLPVGMVTEVKRGEFGVVESVALTPSVDLDAVEEVAVLPTLAEGLDLLP